MRRPQDCRGTREPASVDRATVRAQMMARESGPAYIPECGGTRRSQECGGLAGSCHTNTDRHVGFQIACLSALPQSESESVRSSWMTSTDREERFWAAFERIVWIRRARDRNSIPVDGLRVRDTPSSIGSPEGRDIRDHCSRNSTCRCPAIRISRLAIAYRRIGQPGFTAGHLDAICT